MTAFPSSPPAPENARPRGQKTSPGAGLLTGPVRKLLLIAGLFLCTLIAGAPINGVIEEREARQAGVLAEFKQSWGPEQNLRAPVLVVPYQTGQSRQYLKIVPARLKMNARLAPEERKRGLFHATVYNAAVEFEGSYAIPAETKLRENLGDSGASVIQWDQSFVVLEASSLSGVSPGDRFIWNGEETSWQNCWEALNSDEECKQSPLLAARPHITSESAAGTQIPFRATVNLRGTGSFQLLYHGRELDAAISAPWSTPSFTGNLLPSASNVTAQGFEAHWQTVAFSSPQVWQSRYRTWMYYNSGDAGPGATVIGANLLDATPAYRIIHRASKYSILFVVLAFTTYFLFELLSKARIHAVQYGLLGASLTLFTLLLISFSEPLGYTLGYAISAGLVLLQATLYTAAVARRPLHAALFGTMLATLFGFLYVLLSLETYSMLAGALGLFIVLSVVMAITQRVDWQGDDAPAGAEV
jgi:inner membrane protein